MWCSLIGLKSLWMESLQAWFISLWDSLKHLLHIQEHRYSVYWYTWRTARCHRQSSWKRFQTSACKVFFSFSNGWKRLFVYACFDSFKNQLKMTKSWESSQKLKKKKPSVQTNRSLYLYSCLLAQSLESEISSKFLKDTYKII